jgi:hypothetical protein
MPSRRHVLALLAATPFATSCGEGLPDYAAAWRSPGAGEADARRFALAHAILAPNPHNTQPWLVELRGEDEMLLYCDLERRLPFTDPLDRQITMGCGAFLELYRIAAAERGQLAEVTPFPEGAPAGPLDARPVALMRFNPVANAAPDPLFTQIASRRTNRNEYDPARAPSAAHRTEIATASAFPGAVHSIGAASDDEQVAAIRNLVWRAFDREMRTRGAQEETYKWLRFGRNERARHRDGLYIDVPVPGLLRAIGMLGEDDIVNPDSNANKQAARDWKRKVDSAPAFMWLATPDDAPTTRLLAGMAYARMNLAATAAGLAMHPWSQALQEYAEMADLNAEAKTLLGVDSEQTVQMLARVGYADSVEPAARRELGAFLKP